MVKSPVAWTGSYAFMQELKRHGLLDGGFGKSAVYSNLVRRAESMGFDLTAQERDQTLRALHGLSSDGLPDVFDAIPLGGSAIMEILFEWGKKYPQLEGSAHSWERFLKDTLRSASRYITPDDVSIMAKAYGAGWRDGSHAND